MSTWKSLARRTNSLPEGWSNTEEIATDLDCEPSEVPKILASAIRDGLVEKQNFPHWQPGSRQLLYQTGYRQISEKQTPIPDKSMPVSHKRSLEDHVRIIKSRHPDFSAYKVKSYLSNRIRDGVSTAQISAILDTLSL
jgi:hypothetical protein